MDARPKLKVELRKTDKVLEVLCLMALVSLWVGTVAGFSQLPEQIPSHFNASGKADDFSGKTHIFFLPVVATILYIALTILNQYPHRYNYTTAVTHENAKPLYASATRLVRVLKLSVILILSGIVFMTYKSVVNRTEGLGAWFLPVSLGFMLVPTIVYLLIPYKTKP